MLSRTADSLYWLSRYVERAEYLARIIDATQRLTSLPSAYGGASNEWFSTLTSAGCAESFAEVYDEINEANVVEYLAFSPKNPSSIRNCLEIARTNARHVRTALTREMWDAINGAWLELKEFDNRRLTAEDTSRFLEWVKQKSLLYDGSAYRTMLRNDGFWFSRLGLNVERADNTARLLDVKFHVLLPESAPIGGSLDYFQWAAILRSVSALNSFHWVYRESLKPWLIADFLILNDQMPRSLANCYQNLVRYLDEIAVAYGRQGPSQRQARSLRTKLGNHRIDEVFQSGLHEFVTEFITDNSRLAGTIAEQYLV